MVTSSSDLPVARVVAGLIAGVFFGGLAGGVAFPTLPQLGVLLGISPFLVGVILSINRFARLVMTTPAGGIIDSIGTRRPMIAGFAVQGSAPFGYAVALYADQLPLTAAHIFLASRVLWGGVGGTNPPLLALLGDISPRDDVGKLGGVYNVFGDIVSTAGPLVALPVATYVGYGGEYAASAGLVVLAVGLVVLTLLQPATSSAGPPPEAG